MNAEKYAQQTLHVRLAFKMEGGCQSDLQKQICLRLLQDQTALDQQGQEPKTTTTNYRVYQGENCSPSFSLSSTHEVRMF